MAKGVHGALARVFFDRADTWRMLAFTVVGFAFSQAVILCTIGLMDGFEEALKGGLRRSSGDAILTHRHGFFTVDPAARAALAHAGVRAHTEILQSEAFAVHAGRTRGVLVRGVEGESFRAVTALAVAPTADQAVVGAGLAEDWGLRAGDNLTLLLAGKAGDDLPLFLSVKVSGPIRHGLHEKDARLIYVDRTYLASQLDQSRANVALPALPTGVSVSEVDERVRVLRDELATAWNTRAAWHEFGGILEAAQVEKTSITVILQLIVLVAVFNVAAFLITLRVRKAQEYFLVCAVGLPRKHFFAFGPWLLLAVWALSCACATVMVWGFDWLLAHAPWLRVPGDIYLLTQLRLVLGASDYVAVFLPAMAWIAVVGWFTARRLRRQSLLTGLRQEFA